jgi:hypothetical protein
MSRRDFENAEESGKYTYDPGKRNVKPNKDVPETLKAYYGPTLTPAVVEEIKAWAEVLNAIKDGIPKPYDTSVIVSKIQKLERDTGKDFSELKNCCPPSADFREAKEVKPYIFAILDRIVDVSGIEGYVKKYK